MKRGRRRGGEEVGRSGEEEGRGDEEERKRRKDTKRRESVETVCTTSFSNNTMEKVCLNLRTAFLFRKCCTQIQAADVVLGFGPCPDP